MFNPQYYFKECSLRCFYVFDSMICILDIILKHVFTWFCSFWPEEKYIHTHTHFHLASTKKNWDLDEFIWVDQRTYCRLIWTSLSNARIIIVIQRFNFLSCFAPIFCNHKQHLMLKTYMLQCEMRLGWDHQSKSGFPFEYIYKNNNKKRNYFSFRVLRARTHKWDFTYYK